ADRPHQHAEQLGAAALVRLLVEGAHQPGAARPLGHELRVRGVVRLGREHPLALAARRQATCIVAGSTGTWSSGPVAARTSSTETPGASSRRTSPFGVTSTTARSVITRCTTPLPVYGSVQASTSLCEPSFATCSIMTITRF